LPLLRSKGFLLRTRVQFTSTIYEGSDSVEKQFNISVRRILS